jgi:hypothetical protein
VTGHRSEAERGFAKINHLRALCLDPIQKLLLLVVDLVGWVSQKMAACFGEILCGDSGDVASFECASMELLAWSNCLSRARSSNRMAPAAENGASATNGTSKAPGDAHGLFELQIARPQPFVSNTAIRPHTFAFEQLSLPGVPSSGRDADKIAMRNLIDTTADDPTSRLSADYGSKLAFLDKGRDPFAGASRALIYEDNRATVERLGTKSFGHYAHRIVTKAEL